MDEILKWYGTIKQSQQKRYTIFFLLSYKDKNRNIKIEINLRDFNSKYEIKNYLGISMKVMLKEDMFANKLVAMYERRGKANRDIFDVWFFLKNGWSINKEIIKKRTNLSFKVFLHQCINMLEKLSDRHILSGIGELLDQIQKNWIKNNLRKDTIFLLKIQLSEEN
jgi:predicted nucleotidyltransferase component of viral defense system